MIIILSVNSIELKDSRYVLYLAEQLKASAEYLYICTNDKIENTFWNELNRISKYCYKYNSMFNSQKWKYILINKIDRRICKSQNGVIFVDDSIFGPLYSLDDVIKKGQDSYSDFWGITIHSSMNLNGQIEIDRFIQSYFLCVKKKILQSKLFWEFFENIPIAESIQDENFNFEFRFTKYLEDNGFIPWAFFDGSKQNERDSIFFMSYLMYDITNLVKNYGCPFISKYMFDIKLEEIMNYNSGKDLRNIIKYIEDKTDYDINLIFENMLYNKNLGEIQIKFGLNFIPNEDDIIYDENNYKFGFFSFLYYDDLFEFSLEKLFNLPKCFDIYVATDSQKKVDRIKEIWREKSNRNIHVLVHKYHGRDISALLLTFRKYLLKYDIFGFIHDKKSGQFHYETIGRDYNYELWESMLESEKYINGTMNLLIKKTYLGFLNPPMPIHNLYFSTLTDAWTCCYEQTAEIANILKQKIRIDRNINPVSLGSVFWCKTCALKPLLEYDFKPEQFPYEPMPVDGTFNHGMERIFPYIAQSQGFCSGIVSTKGICESNELIERNILTIILDELKGEYKDDMYTLFAFVNSLKKKTINEKETIKKKNIINKLVGIIKRALNKKIIC